MDNPNWIGFDLDGTLAYYDSWKGFEHIGDPIPRTVERLLSILKLGITVKIFTARVASNQPIEDILLAKKCIAEWCLKHIGRELDVTSEKDMYLIEFYDDRAVQVEYNTGRIIQEIQDT